jgi:hypothetical protein
MDDISMYISTCDATMNFIPIFSYFYDKYWTKNNKLKFLGFSPCPYKLNKRCEYISLADNQLGGVNNWSTYLINYFNSIDDEIILFGIDDHFIVDFIDETILEYLIDVIKQNKSIGRISLIDNIDKRPHENIIDLDHFTLIRQNQNTNYRIDCQFSLWRKDYLLNYMLSKWTPWDFEIEGSKLARNDGYEILGTSKRYCVIKIEGKRHFEQNSINLLGARYLDIMELIDKNIIKKENIVGRIDWIWIGQGT